MLRRQEERLEREGERHLWVRPLWRRGRGNDGDMPWKDAEGEREKGTIQAEAEGGLRRSVGLGCATKNGKYVCGAVNSCGVGGRWALVSEGHSVPSISREERIHQRQGESFRRSEEKD